MLQRDTGVIVRRPLKTLTDRQKAQYMRFEEDWADEVVNGSAFAGFELVLIPQIEVASASLGPDPWEGTDTSQDEPIDMFMESSLCISQLWPF